MSGQKGLDSPVPAQKSYVAAKAKMDESSSFFPGSSTAIGEDSVANQPIIPLLSKKEFPTLNRQSLLGTVTPSSSNGSPHVLQDLGFTGIPTQPKSLQFQAKPQVSTTTTLAQMIKSKAQRCQSTNRKDKQALRFFKPSTNGDNVTVVLPNSALDEGISKWANSLVGQFVGKSPNIRLMQKMANILWGKKGTIKISTLPGNLFLFNFESIKTASWCWNQDHGTSQTFP